MISHIHTHKYVCTHMNLCTCSNMMVYCMKVEYKSESEVLHEAFCKI